MNFRRGKPQIDTTVSTGLTTLREIEDLSTITRLKWDGLCRDMKNFVAHNYSECNSPVPFQRFFGQEPFRGLVNRFLEGAGLGKLYWSKDRDEFNVQTHLEWEEDNEAIRYLVFSLMKRETYAQRRINKRNIRSSGASTPSLAPKKSSEKKRKENAPNTNAITPTAKKQRQSTKSTDSGKKQQLPLTSANLALAGNKSEMTISSEGHSDMGSSGSDNTTIVLQDPGMAHGTGFNFLGHQVKPPAEKQEKAGGDSKAQGLFKKKEEETYSQGVTNEAKNMNLGTEMGGNANDIKSSDTRSFTFIHEGLNKSFCAIQGKGANNPTVKKRAAESEEIKESFSATGEGAGGAKRAKANNEGQKKATAGTKDANTTVNVGKAGNVTQQEAKAGAAKTKEKPAENNLKLITPQAASEGGTETSETTGTNIKPTSPISNERQQSDPFNPELITEIDEIRKAHDQAPAFPANSREIFSTDLEPYSAAPAYPSLTLPLGEEGTGFADDRLSPTTAAIMFQDLTRAHGDIEYTSDDLQSLPTSLQDISDEIEKHDFRLLKKDNANRDSGSGSGSVSEGAAALAPTTTTPNDSAGPANISGPTNPLNDKVTNTMTNAAPIPTKLPPFTSSLVSISPTTSTCLYPTASPTKSYPATTTTPPPLTSTTANPAPATPTLLITLDISLPTYSSPHKTMLSVPSSISFGEFYGTAILALSSSEDRHALVDAGNVRISSGALGKDVVVGVFSGGREGAWRAVLRRSIVGEKVDRGMVEVEVCFF